MQKKIIAKNTPDQVTLETNKQKTKSVSVQQSRSYDVTYRHTDTQVKFMPSANSILIHFFL